MSHEREQLVPWIEETKRMGYKYPLKAPRHKNAQDYHKKYQRKLRRQGFRLIDKKIRKAGPSKTFTFRVARVRTGWDDNWRLWVEAPQMPYRESSIRGYHKSRTWRGFEDHGPVELHLRHDPTGFQKVIRVTADGSSQLLSTEQEFLPSYVLRWVRKKIEKIRDRGPIGRTGDTHPPLYGPSEEGVELAMKLQSEYGLKAENLFVPEQEKIERGSDDEQR